MAKKVKKESPKLFGDAFLDDMITGNEVTIYKGQSVGPSFRNMDTPLRGYPAETPQSQEVKTWVKGNITSITGTVKSDWVKGWPESPSGIPTRILRISQSMMKAVRSYLEGGDCGLVIREKYIKGRLFDDASQAMKLGTYFEYILTGALPKNGKVPQPEYMKSVLLARERTIKSNAKIAIANQKLKPGKAPKPIKEIKELTVNDMYEPYREAHVNRDKLLKMWNEMGLEIAKDHNGKKLVGWTVIKPNPWDKDKPDIEGTIDVVLEATRDITFADGFTLKAGERICNDLKYSGLADDRWSVHGWQWTPIQKQYHGTQAKHYFVLTELRQFFTIVDPKGNYILFFRVKINPSAIDMHMKEANELHTRLMQLEDLGSLEARPEVNKCAECVLFAECSYKHTYPHPVMVDLTLNDDE